MKQFQGFQTWQQYIQVIVQKYANQGFLFPNLKINILHQTLLLNKFEGVNFKYDNGFFEIKPENIQIKHFLVINISNFYFCMKLESTDFENGNNFFQIPAKIPKFEISLKTQKIFPFKCNFEGT